MTYQRIDTNTPFNMTVLLQLCGCQLELDSQKLLSLAPLPVNHLGQTIFPYLTNCQEGLLMICFL